MKLAFVFDEFEIGGIERVGCDYIRLLRKKGIDIDVYNLQPGKNAMARELPKGTRFYEVQFNRLFCPELYSYGVQKWQWGKFAYPVIYLAASAVLGARKVLSPKREYDAAIAFSGHINDLTFVTSGFVKGRQKICWCHGTMLSYLAICDAYAVLYKKIDKFVTLSEQGIHNVYAGHSFLYKKKIKNLYNPILIKERTVDKEHVAQLKAENGKFMLMVARFTAQKAPRVAMQAVKELKRRGIRQKILFIGDGEELERCRKYAAKNHIADLCRFEGARRDVQDYMAASYINVLASVFEGLPTAIAEAMAFAKPCVMTDSDGGEVSGNGKYCFLVKVGDYMAMAGCLEKLYKDAETYSRYSMLAAQRFRYFKPENIMREFINYLDA